MAGRGTVLIADDDPAIVDFIIEALTDEGYTASGVYNGVAAIAAILAHSPDLALIDLLMDGVTGLEVIQTIRGRGIDVPLVLMTANTLQVEAIQAQGAETCLLKPFDLDNLLACVAKHIRPPT
jgi:DNA-binding response OmpR family regulator